MATTKEIRASLLANPETINVHKASYRLLQRHESSTRTFGVEYHLTQLRALRIIGLMFADVMPEAHAKYAKKSYFEQARAFWDSLKFPIYDMSFEEILEDGGNPLHYPIPICGENPFMSWDYETFEDLPLYQQITTLMYRPPKASGNEDEKRQWEAVATKYKLPPKLRPTGRASLDIFAQVCAEIKTPLRLMSELFTMFDFNTESLFYNFNPNDYTPEFWWSAQNVRFLQAEFEKAKVLNDHVEEIDKWFRGKHASRRVADAMRLYHRVRKLTLEEEKEQAATASQGKPLVGIL